MRFLPLACGCMVIGCAANTQVPGQISSAYDCRLPANSGDTTVYDTTQVGAKGYLLRGPRLSYPEGPRDRGIQGRVMLSFIIDTAGRAEPQSIVIDQSLQLEMNIEVLLYV